MGIRMAAAAAAVAFALAGTAQSATIVQSFGANTIAPGTLHSFDATLGTLIGVTIDWSGTVGESFHNPTYPGPQGFSGNYGGDIGFMFIRPIYTNLANDYRTFSGFYDCGTQITCGIGGGGSGSLTADPTPFVGTDDFYAQAFGSVGVVGQGQFEYQQANIGGTLTYIYAAVPEPATWAMMLAGFGAIGYATRRRSRMAFA